jgi:hypothetical protein
LILQVSSRSLQEQTEYQISKLVGTVASDDSAQQVCYRLGDPLAGGLLIEGETGRRVDLEAIRAAFRRAAQIDASDNQTEFGRQAAAECATIVDAEVLPSLEDIKRELAEFECQGPALQEFLKDAARLRDPMAFLEHHIAELRSTLRWRTLRHSPARCLSCTSHDFTYLPWKMGDESKTMQHPSCAGMLDFKMYAHAVPRERRYSVEGQRLAS